MKPPSDDLTVNYYNQNGQAFFDSTVSIGMETLYAEFLPLIPKSGRILDVGCGSGRDSKAFLNKGYQITAIDPSAKMVELASAYIGQPVLQQDARALDDTEVFDGVWVCASLLHLPESSLPTTFQKLAQALKPNGVMYVSFKLGESERQESTRHFTDMTLARLNMQLAIEPSLKLLKSWITQDLRPEMQTQWLNALIQKAPST